MPEIRNVTGLTGGKNFFIPKNNNNLSTGQDAKPGSFAEMMEKLRERQIAAGGQVLDTWRPRFAQPISPAPIGSQDWSK